MTEEYRVQLDVFTGPLDLLLYLVRRDELDIQDISLTRLADQYLDYVHLLEELDPNAASEFLVMAATLAEWKSRALLPTPPLDAADDADDPQANLVRKLLEYKRFKDAARALGAAADERAKRFVRAPANLPPELQGVELEEVEVWDLLSAFGRVMTSIGRGPGVHEVRYDDVPLEQHQADIMALISARGATTFRELFDGTESKAQIVGRFLALLELLRTRRLRAEQERVFGEIYLFLLAEAEPEAEAEAQTA
ncbi:Segregation and condensation protein A [Phycisphaerae bacterium RAS1]|nr:Segregation and condensation protein A [Phycisphaerae bacterium RAS1]